MTGPRPEEPIPQLRLYREWLERERALRFADYAAMWEWSTTDLAAFWESIWAYHAVESPTAIDSVLSGAMPSAEWFAGARVNYARQVFRHVQAADAARQPAIVADNELGEASHLTWRDLQRRSASLALELRRRGVGRGDRVAAYLPNIPEATIALLACASLGAIWTMCSPDMGTPAVLDRFRQIEPKVLIGIDAVRYRGKHRDRSEAIEAIRQGLPSVTATFIVASGATGTPMAGATDFAVATGRDDAEVAAFEPEWLPFEHPLWILYSSGTSGLPKPLVHGHGGVILASLAGNLHLDLGPSYSVNNAGERFHWYSTTGWVMWNVQIGGLLSGTTICLYDGSPKGSGTDDDWTALWSFAGRHSVTWFGAGAAFYGACAKTGLSLSGVDGLAGVRALGSTGSPLAAETEQWGSAAFAAFGRPGIWWCNISGGTDIAAAFLSGNRELPPTPGRLQCRHLGAAVEAWDESGHAVVGAVGELVCTRPFPSMPLFFWKDEGGSRYRSTYFDKWEGIWRHGDWLTVEPDGSCTITGRSDATINRHGLRMGTAEIYTAVEGLEGVADSLVIDLQDGDGDSTLTMFVVPSVGRQLDAELRAAVTAAIRSSLSPRFVPDALVSAPAIPRTLSGKKQELPVKRLFQGWPVAKVMDPNLSENPEVIPWYVEQAQAWLRASNGADRKVAEDAK